MSAAGQGSIPATNKELSQELINVQAEREMPLMQARARFAELVLEDIEWWYDQVKYLATKGDALAGHTVRVIAVKLVLDKICPDRKEISRGAAHVGGAFVQINNLTRGTEASVDHAKAVRDRAVDATVVVDVPANGNADH